MGLCQPARCGCGIRSSTLTVRGSGNEGDPYVIDGINPPVYTEATLPGPGVRFVGLVVSTSDTMRLLRWTGTVWTVISEPPQSWTPILTQGVTLTTILNSRWYQRSNGVVHLHLDVNIASSGTPGDYVLVANPPVPWLGDAEVGGIFRYIDSGTTNYVGQVQAYGGGAPWVLLVADQMAWGFGFNPPSFQAVSNDRLLAQIWYRYA